MFKKKFKSLEETNSLENVEEDYKTSKRVGQFRVSEKAIYRPDGTYLPVVAIKKATHDKTSVHVSGCCAGGVPVERIIFDTEGGRFPFIFDSNKDVEKVFEVMHL